MDFGGNADSQFLSIAKQLDPQITSTELRLKLQQYMRSNKNEFKTADVEVGYLYDGMTYDDYVRNITEETFWGDDLSLKGLSLCLKRNIDVYSKVSRGTINIKNIYTSKHTPNPLRVAVYMGYHYCAVLLPEEQNRSGFQLRSKLFSQTPGPKAK